MEKQAEICETYQLKWSSYNSYMHSCISNSLYSDSHADVALVTTDGHQILAHRFVLSYSSVFLSQVLRMYRKVTTALPIMVVLPPEIDHKSLKILVRYMYSGEAKVSKEILEKVLKGGDILQIKGLYREKEDDNGNCKITQNTQRPTPSDQPTPPLLVTTTPTPPLTNPPPLVPTTPIAAQKNSQPQKAPQATIVKKPTSTVTTSTSASAAKVQPNTNSKFIVLQTSKEQPKYANTRQKVLNFTILQNFDKNQKKDDNAKPVTILNKSLGQMKDNEKTEVVTVKAEPGESNSLQYLMVKNEPIDWADADMEIMDSKADIYDDVTVKSEANTEEHSDDSNDSTDRILEFSPLTCELCTETFTIPAEWVRHVQSHTDMMPAKRRRRDSTGDSYENDTFPELMCDLCQKSFGTPAEWVRHIQNSHSEFELHLSNKMKPNAKTTTSSASSTNTASTSTTPVDGYKHCGICNKSFPSHASMVIHQRRHTGEKPYACDICPRSFNVKSNLLRHLRTLHNKIINSTDVENKETDSRKLRRSLPPVPKLIRLSVEEEEQKKS